MVHVQTLQSLTLIDRVVGQPIPVSERGDEPGQLRKVGALARQELLSSCHEPNVCERECHCFFTVVTPPFRPRFRSPHPSYQLGRPALVESI
eukprot:7378853-Prymnesium_polylepis.1